MKKIILALAALTLGSQAIAAPSNPPPLDPTKSVVDAANILTPGEEAQVEAQTRQVYDATHHHIVVLTMPTLDGQDVRQYVNNAFRYYKLGNRTRNDGVLLLISMKDPRRLQIEVGYGLEGVLTDAVSPQITDRMVPLMKQGDYVGAVTQGVQDIAGVIQEEVVTPQKLAETAPTARTATQKAEDSDTLLTILVILGLLAIGGSGYYLLFARPKRKRLEKFNGLIQKAKTALMRNNLDEAELHYKAADLIIADDEQVVYGLRAIERQREQNARDAEREVERARQAAEDAKKPKIIERVRETFSKPAAPVGRTPTSSRSYSPPPAPPKPAPKRDDGAAARAAAAAEEARREARRRSDREDEDRRRRDREDQERRDRDSWSSSSSSSSSWGSSDSSSSSSYDSGGSSGGGGGGSDW